VISYAIVVGRNKALRA